MPDENYNVSETEINMRLDKFLSGKLPGMSRSYIQILLLYINLKIW